jgi:ribosomal protein S18 acetylase RimI-like enzyme
LDDTHETGSFDCGEQKLDEWLRRFALANTRSGLSRTFVAVRPGDRIVCGYFALSTGSVIFNSIPDHVRLRLPKYPIPTVHLGRLAVDRASQGQKLGETLLVEALARAGVASVSVGVYAVDVIALTPRAKAFYEKYGFKPLLDDTLHLYLPIETARQVAGIVAT